MKRKLRTRHYALLAMMTGLATVAWAGGRECFTNQIRLPFEVDEFGNIQCHDHGDDHIEVVQHEEGGPPTFGIAKICFSTKHDRLKVVVRATIPNPHGKKVRLKNDPEIENCVEDEIAREIHHYTHGGGHHEATVSLHDDGEEGHDDHDGKGRTTVHISRSLLTVNKNGRLKFTAKGTVTIGERGPGGGGGMGGGGPV